MSEQIETKLGAARTKLILDKPFLGALVLRLPMVAAKSEWCPTTFTDAKKFYYNAEYIADISSEQVQFVMSREALHCALSHFSRRGHRIKHLWDMACDFAINPILVKEGLEPPADVIVMQQYGNMTAEEIYPLLEDNDNDQERDLQDNKDDDDNDQGKQDKDKGAKGKSAKSDGDGSSPEQQEQSSDQGAGGDANEDAEQGGQQQPQLSDADEGSGDADEPQPLTEAEKETLTIQWQQRMAGAAQQAMAAGKLGDSMMRLVDFMLQPKLPWRSLLARYMNAIARDDYTYSRPSSRRGDPALFPSLRSAQLNVTVALDISGSISDKEINEFVAEIDAIKATVRARVTLQACDAQLAEGGPWEFEPWEEFAVNMKLKGGGGTKFSPVFDWVNAQDSMPDLLVYFTDAQGEFPPTEPNYPVLWLVKGKTQVPFGQRIQLN
ncbi:MAG: VWA-like domain-containing protein [Gammaproteobacteria bacterium]|nr:VWA-like domain-containing protein [Gammaproteobacteria bacterium]